jgi:hypothetical protein
MARRSPGNMSSVRLTYPRSRAMSSRPGPSDRRSGLRTQPSINGAITNFAVVPTRRDIEQKFERKPRREARIFALTGPRVVSRGLPGSRRRVFAAGVHLPRSKSGSLARFAAIRRASSLVSSLAAERRPVRPRNKYMRAPASFSSFTMKHGSVSSTVHGGGKRRVLLDAATINSLLGLRAQARLCVFRVNSRRVEQIRQPIELEQAPSVPYC